MTRVDVIEDCTVRLQFDDGLIGDVDLSYLLSYGPVFEPLRDPDFFRLVDVDPAIGTIVWPNGADVAPETLYDLAASRQPQRIT